MVCAVVGCQTGSKWNKGPSYTLYSFDKWAKSKKLRQQWIDQLNRQDFKPTKSSVVCGKHFEEHCFLPYHDRSRGRKRQRRLLKPRAIPTLYLRPSQSCDEGESSSSAITASATNDPKIVHDHSYLGGKKSSEETPLDTMIQNVEVTVGESNSEQQEESAKLKNPPLTSCRNCIDTVDAAVHKAVLDRIKVLEAEAERKDKIINAVQNIFNEDQIRKMLLPSTSTMHWDSTTIMESIYLYYKSGTTLYKYLRENRKHPLPSISTLKYHLRQVECEPGVLSDFIGFMKKPAENLKEYQKFCILCVDEMALKVISLKLF